MAFNDLLDKAGIEASKTRGAKVDSRMMTLSAPGIFSAGNVLHVHDLVDYVSEEAEEAGERAAEFALSGLVPKTSITFFIYCLIRLFFY